MMNGEMREIRRPAMTEREMGRADVDAGVTGKIVPEKVVSRASDYDDQDVKMRLANKTADNHIYKDAQAKFNEIYLDGEQFKQEELSQFFIDLVSGKEVLADWTPFTKEQFSKMNKMQRRKAIVATDYKYPGVRFRSLTDKLHISTSLRSELSLPAKRRLSTIEATRETLQDFGFNVTNEDIDSFKPREDKKQDEPKKADAITVSGTFRGKAKEVLTALELLNLDDVVITVTI